MMSTKQVNTQVYPEVMWMGTDHALMLAEQAETNITAGMFDGRASKEEDELPWNMSIDNGVAVVAIKGPLVNRDSPYNKYAGVTSYSDIRRAMIAAATMGEVKAILLDINSGGGDVSGVADAGDLIKSIDKGIKPVYSYTEGNMASAAYWIGVSAREVRSSTTSMVGSIGVLATHKEYSKMFKEAGIGVTIVRHGEFKALINMYEPLTQKALTQLEGQLAQAYSVFITHVAGQLGMTVDKADKQVGQGREFFGVAAVQAGLSAGIESFDSMMGRIQAKLLDTARLSENNSGKYTGYDMTKQALTPAQVAAIAAGAPITDEATAAAAAAQAAAAQAEADAAAAAATAAAAAATAAATQATQSDGEKDKGVVDLLKGQLAEAQVAALKHQVDLAKAVDKIASMEGSFKALIGIAAKAVSNMKVGLGMTKVDLSAMTAEQIVAEHAATEATFVKAFPIGGVSATNLEDPAKPKAAVDPHRKARIDATRFETRN